MLGSGGSLPRALADVHLERACIRDNAAAWLAEEVSCKLTRLVLSHARFSRSGAEALAAWIGASSTLRTLHLIHIEGEAEPDEHGHIIHAVAGLSSVQELCIYRDWQYRHEHAGEDTAADVLQPLADALPALHRLTRLELSAPEAGEAQRGCPAASAFTAALTALTALRQLHVSHVRMGEVEDMGRGAVAFAQAVAGMPSLQRVHLVQCLPYMHDAAAPLIDGLARAVREAMPAGATLWDRPLPVCDDDDDSDEGAEDWSSSLPYDSELEAEIAYYEDLGQSYMCEYA